MTAEELIAFEKDIATHWEAGEIKAPVHLHGGNECELIEIFKNIKPQDWVFSTHRSHYHALLKGIPPELVKAEILKGNSISLQFPEYRFFTSAIVGGICPIALGVAMAGETVWCFVGDMAATTGIFNECMRYGGGHQSPFHLVVEDNDYSVESPTKLLWSPYYGGDDQKALHDWFAPIDYYRYKRTYPHHGAGKYVIFK